MIAEGTVLRGKVSWFGGPHDPTSGPTTASGSPISAGGIAVYDRSTLGGYWQLTFPNGHTVIEKQTDIGPAPWTGRKFDVAYSSLAGAGYSEATFPTGATVTGVYLGKSLPAGASTSTSPTSPSSSPASSSSTLAGAPGGLAGTAIHGILYLALIVGAAALLWLGTKTTLQPRKRAS